MLNDKCIDYFEFKSEWLSGYRKIVEAFLRKESFQVIQTKVFNIVLSKLCYLLGRNQAIHCFVNPNPNFGEHHKGVMHYMALTDKLYSILQMDDNNGNLFSIRELDNNFWDSAKSYFIKLDISSDIDNCDILNGKFWQVYKHRSNLNISSDLSLVRFSTEYENEIYNLGFGIFWNDNNHPSKIGPTVNHNLLISYIKDLQKLIISKFIESGGIESGTYFPDYRTTGPNTVSILFCDIRNFTTVTEILRNKNKFAGITSFINKYCQHMSNVIRQYGRLDKFMGDGIMAIFGEYTDNKSEMCGKALLCSQAILEEFRKCKDDWLKKDNQSFNLYDFMKEFNENIDIDLGIGLNVGEVYFDYFGAKDKMEYSAISDHVNFAQRLESNAAQVTDLESGRRREPILVSQSFFNNSVDDEGNSFFSKSYIENPQRSKPIYLQIKGLSNRYPIYMLNNSDINDYVITDYLNKISGISQKK